MRIAGHILGALLAATPAAAEDMPFHADPTAACVARAEGAACIGRAARACTEAQGPMSAGVCMGGENAWWLGRMGRALAALRNSEGVVIARAERLGWPAPVPSLDAVMRGFEAYREAACGWRAAAWDGLHAGVEEMACLLEFNARHALWLEAQGRAP